MLVTAEMVGNSFALIEQRLRSNLIDDAIDEIYREEWRKWRKWLEDKQIEESSDE